MKLLVLFLSLLISVQTVFAQGAEPPFTDVRSQVSSFLWKPISDTNPRVSVITVSAEAIRSDDLRVQVFDKKGKLLKLDEKKNKYSNGRGNPLPGFKYARINFKPGWTSAQFKRVAPITVQFYVSYLGKKIPVLVLGKTGITIKNPHQRIDLK